MLVKQCTDGETNGLPGVGKEEEAEGGPVSGSSTTVLGRWAKRLRATSSLKPSLSSQPVQRNLWNTVTLKWLKWGASLVAQWLRICLPMQGTRVRALVWEDPTCRGAARPVSHNYWACASGACAPERERPRQWEARAPRWRVAPACRN